MSLGAEDAILRTSLQARNASCTGIMAKRRKVRRRKWNQVIWDPSPGGNVAHVEEHGLTTDDVDHVLEHYESLGRSHSTDRPCVFGHVADGRYVIVIFEEADGDCVIPITAYEVSRP